MKIAVIGAGISGLGTAYLLSQRYEVHLFESAARLGGHANTVTVSEPHATVPIDTGFLVYNELTYPNLVGLFRALNVETTESEMSLSVQVKEKNLEWGGSNLNAVYGQRKNLFNPQFHKMLLEILRFHREAEMNLTESRVHAWSLGALLKARGYTRQFCHDYMIPIGAAIWSTPEKRMLDFPAETFLTFFMNHRLLQVNERPIWRTVKNGSIQYVQKIAAHLSHVHLNAAIEQVERRNGKVFVKTQGEEIEFDRVVMATHAPITMKLLKMPSDHEQRVLSAFKTEQNRTVLHSDVSVMPQEKRCWSSWNVVGSTNHQLERKVALSYYLNRLQPLPTQKKYFVTLNSDKSHHDTHQELEYHHPLFDRAAILAQQELPQIQGQGGVYYAGAWSRYGFHEDGLLSAVKVAQLMGVDAPWSPL